MATVDRAEDWNAVESEACGCGGQTSKGGAHWSDGLPDICVAPLTPALALAVLAIYLSPHLQDTGLKSELFLYPLGHLGLNTETITCFQISVFVFKSLSISLSIFHLQKGIRVLYLKALDIFF